MGKENTSTVISNKAKASVYFEVLLQYEQPIFQDLESFLRIMQIERVEIISILQKHESIVETYDTNKYL